MVTLGPGVVVDVVVVVAGARDADLEEVVVGLAKQRGRGHEAAAGVPIDADAVEVDEGVPCPKLLQGRLLVSEGVVAEVEVAVAVVGLRALRRSAAVADLDDDEAEVRQGLLASEDGEGVAHPFRLGARVDVGDDRVPVRRVEVEGFPEIPEEVRDSIHGLDHEGLGHLPARLVEPREVRGFEGQDLAAVCIPQGHLGRLVHPVRVVHHEVPARREARVVGGVARIHEGEARSVQEHAVEVVVVDVLSGLRPLPRK